MATVKLIHLTAKQLLLLVFLTYFQTLQFLYIVGHFRNWH